MADLQLSHLGRVRWFRPRSRGHTWVIQKSTIYQTICHALLSPFHQTLIDTQGSRAPFLGTMIKVEIESVILLLLNLLRELKDLMVSQIKHKPSQLVLLLTTANQDTDQHHLGSIHCYPLTYHQSQQECIYSQQHSCAYPVLTHLQHTSLTWK